MLISRKLEESITKKLGSGKVILVLGPRQTGKTTLLTGICRQSERWLLLDCDDLLVREQLQDANVEKLKQIIGTHTLILIDEAQRVRNIGLTLKILADHFDHAQILVSGSSALELANEINEPLTGRKWEFMLYPVSWQELLEQFGYLDTLRQLEQRLIFGQYPEVITHPGQ